jgi:hypothetical protein
MFFKVFQSLITVSLFFCSSVWALSGTGGTPLGGMGTGYVLYSGDKFAVSGKMPPAGADHCKGQAEKQISSSGFHLFAGGTAKSPVKGTSEDAKCPLQRVDFGAVGDVKFDLNAFGPYWPGEGEEKYKLATSPMALFDVAVVNSGAAAVEVAVAMEFANGGSLGGANSGTVETGNKAISFAGSSDNAYLAVDCNGATPAFSAGAAGTFSTDGTLSNAAGNLVAAKCSVPAGGTVHFKFVLAWYRQYDSEGYYYHTKYDNSKEVADAGIANFDSIRVGITSFVDRVMASNFPDWYKDRLLNNTYPLIHNSVCAKDGRCAFWEGNYGIIGTIDQGQHAAVFYTFNWPQVQWQELEYWARQTREGGELDGQVHHDFNQGTQQFTPGSTTNNRHLLDWDNKNHPDYWWFPNSETWSDLNSMFIFKAYELLLATGNVELFKEKYWAAVKKTANRIIKQSGSSKIPLNSHSTYDQKENGTFGYTPEYSGNIALPAYLAMVEMAKICGENDIATKFTEQFTGGKTEFKQKYGSNSSYGTSGRFAEGHIAGYSWANYLCLDPIMDEDFITPVCKKMRDKQSSGIRANGEWIFYNVDHYGGAEIAINMPDAAMVIHKQDYDEYYKNHPKEVFWQSLQKDVGPTGHDSYMTAPAVWHSYFQFCGYMIDNSNQRLWIRPRIPTEMNGEITKALLLNPKALGTFNYNENADAALGRTQTMTVSFDKPVTIKEIMLKNNTGVEAPFVVVAGSPNPTIKPEGSGLEKNIRVTLAAPIQIGPEGVKIDVYKQPVAVKGVRGSSLLQSLALKTFCLSANTPIHYSADVAGTVTMELLTINGAKIGTIMKENVTAGINTFMWNGKTVDGRQIGSVFAVLRLSSPAGSVTKTVVTGR